MDQSRGTLDTTRTDALLEAAEANLVARRTAGAEQLRIAYDWAFTHRRTSRPHPDDQADTGTGTDAEARAQRDLKRLGACGFPIDEYAPASWPWPGSSTPSRRSG